MVIKSKNIESAILFSTIILVLIGIMVVGDIASFRFDNSDFLKQLLWIGVSIPLCLLFYFLDLHILRKLAFPLLILGLLLLVAVLVPGIGTSVNGSFRRIDVGPIGFQPSTIARLILIFYLAHFLAKNQLSIDNSSPLKFVRHFSVIIIFPVLYFLLIYKEPDLSTAGILFLIYISMLFVARIKFSTTLSMILVVSVFLIVSLITGPDYRRARISAFSHFVVEGEVPDGEDERYWYQPHESLVALSQGKALGKGSGEGRAKLFYLPFVKTDYVFTVIGEEFGFIGSCVLIALYLIVIIGGLTLAQNAGSLFYSLLISGLVFNLAYNVIINIGVATSLIPPTGVSLPFISYGGSAFMIDSISIALILNASRRARAEQESLLARFNNFSSFDRRPLRV
ncbi:MAG: FtsW/RodA/SpoVE family cell cycle protein [Candidatus Cloacimonadia bacterium]